MAIDVKALLADGLLKLCKKKALKNITVKDILDATRVSRQGFYNHFRDKNDLIQYIYQKMIITEWDMPSKELNYYQANIDSFKRMIEHREFLKQACMMDGQNCLKEYMFEHCKVFDLEWHQMLLGPVPMPEELHFATEYHAMASISMTISWILSDMPSQAEEMAELLTNIRNLGLGKLIAGEKNINGPYVMRREIDN